MTAAELANAEERVRVQTSALRHQIENWTKVRDASLAQTETLDRYRAALERIAEAPADMAEQAPWWAREALQGTK